MAIKLNASVMLVASRAINKQLAKAIDHAGVVRGPVKGLHGLSDTQLAKPSYKPEQASTLMYEAPRKPSKALEQRYLTIVGIGNRAAHGSIFETGELIHPPLAVQVPFREPVSRPRWFHLEKPTPLSLVPERGWEQDNPVYVPKERAAAVRSSRVSDAPTDPRVITIEALRKGVANG